MNREVWNVYPWSSLSHMQRPSVNVYDEISFIDWWREYDPPNTADFVYDALNLSIDEIEETLVEELYLL